MRDYDDYIERDCECGHVEHRGLCSRTVTVHYQPGQLPDSLEAAAEPCPWNNGRTLMVRRPCTCTAFREYEGPQEPPDLDRGPVLTEPSLVPEYDHNADLVPPHFLEPDPDDTTSCLRCGDVNGWGCLHLTERGEFDVDDDFGKAPRCPTCPHYAHSAACDVIVSRWPERICPCGGAQCVA